MGQSVRTKTRTTILPVATRDKSKGLPSRSMAKPWWLFERRGLEQTQSKIVGTRRRRKNRKLRKFSVMGFNENAGMLLREKSIGHLAVHGKPSGRASP